MDLKFLFFIGAYIKGLDSCNIRVCLTWAVHVNHIDLRCRVNHLIYGVEFYSNKRIEQGFCLHPKPTPKCYALNNNTKIVQNSKTNVTYLRIKGQIDSNFNGEWECRHGTNRDSAIINVTVFYSDKRCWQSYLSYTMIGFCCCFFICLFYILVYCRIKCLATLYLRLLLKCKCILESKRCDKAIRICVVLVIVALFLIPVIEGLFDHNICRGEEWFIIVGVSMALFLSLLLTHVYMKRENVMNINIPTNRNSDTQNTDGDNEEGLETQPLDTSGPDQPFLSEEGIEETNCFQNA